MPSLSSTSLSSFLTRTNSLRCSRESSSAAASRSFLVAPRSSVRSPSTVSSCSPISSSCACRLSTLSLSSPVVSWLALRVASASRRARSSALRRSSLAYSSIRSSSFPAPSSSSSVDVPLLRVLLSAVPRYEPLSLPAAICAASSSRRLALSVTLLGSGGSISLSAVCVCLSSSPCAASSVSRSVSCACTGGVCIRRAQWAWEHAPAGVGYACMHAE